MPANEIAVVLPPRYLATAAAVAEGTERSGGTAGMADARSTAAAGAAAGAANKRKAAYGIPIRPNAAPAALPLVQESSDSAACEVKRCRADTSKEASAAPSSFRDGGATSPAVKL